MLARRAIPPRPEGRGFPRNWMNILAKTIAVTLVGIGALATNATAADSFRDFGLILRVTPNVERIVTYEDYCPPPRTYYAPTHNPRAEKKVGGAILGGVLGGLAGSTVGKGSGNKWATGVGAIAGAVAGDRIQNDGRPNYDERYDRPVSEYPPCSQISKVREEITGYHVVYQYNGREFTTTMSNHPGHGRIPLMIGITAVE